MSIRCITDKSHRAGPKTEAFVRCGRALAQTKGVLCRLKSAESADGRHFYPDDIENDPP